MSDIRARATLVAALVIIATLIVPGRATACSCIPARLERTVLPVDGTSDFPVNGILRVFLTSFPGDLRSALAQEYRLVDAKGSIVPVESRVVATRLDLRPREPLQPGQRYTLEQLYAFDSAGLRLDDTERAEALDTRPRPYRDTAPRQGLRRAWFPAVAFETSPAPAEPRAPATLTLFFAAMEFYYGGGDCGPGVSLRAALELPATIGEAAVMELEVRSPDMTAMIVSTQPSAQGKTAGASDTQCNPDPVTLPTLGAVEVRLVAVGSDGGTVGVSAWTPADGTPGFPLTPEWHSGRRTAGRNTVSPDAWLSLPVVEAIVQPPAGPASCRNGLEVTSRTELAKHGSPRSYSQHSMVAFDGNRGWALLSSGPKGSATDVREFDASGASKVVRSALVGWPDAIAFGEGGPLIVTHVYQAALQRATTLQALGPTGATRWEVKLPQAEGAHGLATGGGVVLVTWTEPAKDMRSSLSWALFRESDGGAIGSPVASANAITHGLNGGAVAAWADGHFLLAWPGGSRDGAVHVMTLSPAGVAGPPSVLPVRAHGPIDVAAAGGRIGLVSEHHGQIQWTLLSAAGAIERGPVVVSAGVAGADNRKPRVTFRDDLFAVSWETAPSGMTYMAVIDASGAVSTAALLDGNDSSTALVIAAPNRTFLAAYSLGHEGRAMMATLRCRAEAAKAAPQQIRVP